MLQSLEALIQLSQANISESFEIINGSSASVISDAIRELATTCNARLVEVAADCTDLRRKWDRGVGEIAGFTEDDIRSLLPSSIQSVQNPRLEGARRERDIWLRKLEDVRKLCEDKLGEINKLDRPGDDLTASSTAMSIDIHTTVASRQAQLRVLEDVLHVVVKDKENILRRIAELSRLLEDAGEDYAEEESSRELVDTLNTTVRKYIEWRGKAADALTSGLHIREDTCRLLARCLMFPKGPPGDDKPDGGDGGSGASLPPPPSGGKRDPLLAKYLTHSITSGATGTSSNPSPVAALETRLAEASPAPIPPYNPDVIGKAEHLAELRAAAAAAGIEMALICAPRHVETKNFTANVPSGSENNPHHIGRELGLRGLLRDQQEKLAQLMVEKAHRDLMLNRLQEQVQTQKLATHARQFADRYTDLDHSKEEPPIKSIIPVIAKRKPPGGGQAYVSEAGPSGTSDHKKRGKQPSCSPEIIDHGPGGKSHHGVKVTVEHALPETESEDQGSPSSVVDYDRLSIALSAISLSDYHPGTTPEQLLLSSAGIDVTKNLQHMDRLYSQIRVLIVARDALRSNNKRDLQKALSAVRKYHIRSEPAGNDSMSHWVWREMSDAGSRLTETLAALESRDLQPHPAPDFHKTADDSEDIGLEHLPLHARRQRQKERAGGHERLTTVMQTSSDAEVPDGFRNRRAPETRLGTPPDGRVSSWVAEQRKMSMQSNASDHTRSNSKKQDSAVPYEGIASAAAAAAAAGVSAALQYQRTSRNDDPNAGRSSVPTFKAPRRQPAGFTVGNRRKPSREPVAYPTVEDTAEEVSDAAEVPAAAAAEPAHRESHRSDRGVRRGYKQHNDFLVRELAGKDDYGRRH
ncbi:hypothetical protein BC832DRAFT_319400 [Gaertneriomyces semiglobifer]|nr:hypothetical protein BC832DRAFT_319400 [Gaertneriomyces semiglobifer]